MLAIDKQEIETQVEVKSGETLALGGIFTRKNKSGQDSVPTLLLISYYFILLQYSINCNSSNMELDRKQFKNDFII